jgi:hypothetical protein
MAFEAPARPASPAATGEQATIGKGLFIKGDINGSESLLSTAKSRAASTFPATA